MVPLETWVAFTAACILIILVPGPDNILAVSRGLSQGRLAACISSLGASLGLLVHVFLALLGLAALIQTSAIAFSAVKIVGAGYLIWLGVKALRSRSLITFISDKQLPYRGVLVTGFLTNVLNPKPAFFILAFIPQFVSPMYGSIEVQMLFLGTWFALLAFITFTILGVFSSIFARWLEDHPHAILGLNIGAGLTFIAAGLSVMFLDNPERTSR